MFFGLIRIGSDTDIGMIRNSSDWLGMNFYLKLSPGIAIKFFIVLIKQFFQWLYKN